MADQDPATMSEEQLRAALAAARATLQRERQQTAALAAARATLQRERQQTAEDRSRDRLIFDGNFFATIDDVLTASKLSDTNCFRIQDYRNCCRMGYNGNGMQCRTASGSGLTLGINNPYETTFTNAATGNARDNASRTTYNQEKRNAIWPNSVFGPHNAGEIAHLVPHSSTAAESYWFVTDFLYGFEEGRDWQTRRRMIHGVANANPDRPAGVANTGIRHMVPNKIRVAYQRDYLDNSSCLMILPIPTGANLLDWAKNWRGEGYSAIAMIGTHGNQGLESVADLTQFNRGVNSDDLERHTADPGEFRDAVNLLKRYTQAILYAQQKNKPTEVQFDQYPDETNPRLFPTRKRLFTKPVRKITFTANDAGGGHPAPDPLLLLAKMVSVWARRLGFNLCASAEPQEHDECDDDDLSEVAMECFLEWRDKCLAPNPIGMTVTLSPDDRPAA